ncbi:30S ribosomal protein S3 [archaeon CG10_big_fil_rev_8_21_14_0_10_43_11]|nr:MAG: 30S ribosomal protein S3 [archaeon CG10_big_fil_rev_8_21_14_0_10_43_11]
MIERKFISEKVREVKIKQYLKETFSKSAYSHTELQKTPLGMRVVIYTSKPGLVVGAGGANIKAVNIVLQKRFNLENPQVDVEEVKQPSLDAQIMSERLAFQLTRWGVQRFKKIGYSAQEEIMRAGAKGVEILVSGKVPGKRATTWPFRAGYLPKTGYVSDYDVDEGFTTAKLRPGIVGVTVRILRADVRMPDEITIYDIKKQDLSTVQPKKEIKEEKTAQTKKDAEEKKEATPGMQEKKQTQSINKEKPAKKAEKKQETPVAKNTKKNEEKTA